MPRKATNRSMTKNKTTRALLLQLAAPYEHEHPNGDFWRGDAVRAAANDLSAFCGLAHMGGSAEEALECVYRVSQRLSALAEIFDADAADAPQTPACATDEAAE